MFKIYFYFLCVKILGNVRGPRKVNDDETKGFENVGSDVRV
jgi:hypothetical protein